jgi:hypothetical protein
VKRLSMTCFNEALAGALYSKYRGNSGSIANYNFLPTLKDPEEETTFKRSVV